MSIFGNLIRNFLFILTFLITAVSCNNKIGKDIDNPQLKEEKIYKEIIKEKYTELGTFYRYYKDSNDKYFYKQILYFPNGSIEGESYFNNGEFTKAYSYFNDGQLSVSRVVIDGIITQTEYYKDEYISAIRRERMEMNNSIELINFNDRKNRIKRIRKFNGDKLIYDALFDKLGNKL
ncbi:MAG: hypothetical protein H8E55_46415 [Pelagibacterales bacterium]|nr:hypothetical protein [Pelagibacterales bacterium]